MPAKTSGCSSAWPERSAGGGKVFASSNLATPTTEMRRYMMLTCNSCDKEATFDSPKIWCGQHWLEWFFRCELKDVIEALKPKELPETFEEMEELFLSFKG